MIEFPEAPEPRRAAAPAPRARRAAASPQAPLPAKRVAAAAVAGAAIRAVAAVAGAAIRAGAGRRDRAAGEGGDAPAGAHGGGGPLLTRLALLVGVLLAVVTAGVLLVAATTGYADRPLPETGEDPPAEGRAAPSLRELRQQEDRLGGELARLQPRGPWILIDRVHSQFELHRGDDLVLRAPCSAGSGIVLKESGEGRSWTFETPVGRFRVRTRLTDPLWRKPDWHFAEVGESLPTSNELRFEYGVLGEYALDIGDGYMIHGTLYERLLGKNVTHGCIRLGRDHLRVVYRECQVGTPVFIF